jgi:hypothetical protein
VVWALANAAWLSNMLWLLPVFDFGLGVVFLQLWWMARARWVALLVHAVAIRLILHVLDGLSAHLFEVPYIHALNATFVWMIFVVASAGGGHERPATDRRDAMRRRLRFLGGLRPAPASREMTDGG